MKTSTIVLIAIAVSFGVVVLRVVMFPVRTAGNLINTAYEANDKVINADNAIYNYEWFKQQKANIDVTKKQLDNTRAQSSSFKEEAGPREGWTFEDKGEYSRLNTIELGLENYLQAQIGDYNARASMATRNIFENSVLPSFIDALTFIRK